LNAHQIAMHTQQRSMLTRTNNNAHSRFARTNNNAQ
jgi:hypothetical protein